MHDPLADLKRRAYARPEDAAAASEAQAELARLAEEQRRVDRGVNIDLPTVAPFRAGGGRTRAVLGAAALIALAGAVTTYLPPAASLAVFERPQASDDFPTLWPLDDRYLVNDSVRRLGLYEGVELFAYRTVDGDVCLSAQVIAGSASSCTTVLGFRRNGLSMGVAFSSYVEGTSFTVGWGPSGDPVAPRQ